jgi:heat shock protein HslJ
MKRQLIALASTPLVAVGVLAVGPRLSAGAAPDPLTVSGAPPTAPGWPPIPDVEGRTFVATTVEGHDLVEGSEIRLAFDGRSLGVSGGCNLMGGGWSVLLNRLLVGHVTSTMMACEPALMDQDRWVVDFLQSAPHISLIGDTLTLTGADASITLVEVG